MVFGWSFGGKLAICCGARFNSSKLLEARAAPPFRFAGNFVILLLP